MLGKVRVTIIYPGAVESELVEASNDEQTSSQISSNFSGVSFISPSAISRAVRYAIKQPDEVAETRNCSTSIQPRIIKTYTKVKS